jgi:hypothetical protein
MCRCQVRIVLWGHPAAVVCHLDERCAVLLQPHLGGSMVAGRAVMWCVAVGAGGLVAGYQVHTVLHGAGVHHGRRLRLPRCAFTTSLVPRVVFSAVCGKSVEISCRV